MRSVVPLAGCKRDILDWSPRWCRENAGSAVSGLGRSGVGRYGCLDLGGTGLDKADNMLDDVAIRQPVIGETRHIDLMRSLSAACQADIGLARLARAIYHTADDRHRYRHIDMFETLLDHLNCRNHVELVTRTGRAGNHRDTAAAQAQ